MFGVVRMSFRVEKRREMLQHSTAQQVHFHFRSIVFSYFTCCCICVENKSKQSRLFVSFCYALRHMTVNVCII